MTDIFYIFTPIVNVITISTCQFAKTNILTMKLQRIWNKGLKQSALIDFGRVYVLNVTIKVFVGTCSLFLRTIILKTTILSCDEWFSSISLSPTPSKSAHLITDVNVLRQEYGDTMIEELANEIKFRKQLKCLSVIQPTNNDTCFSYVTRFGFPAKPTTSFRITKGDNCVRWTDHFKHGLIKSGQTWPPVYRECRAKVVTAILPAIML